MARVLMWWESRHTRWGNGYQEVYLASAFDGELNRNREYVRVPPHLTGPVSKYIAALLVAHPDKEAA